MLQLNTPSLVPIIISCLFGAKPLPEPVLIILLMGSLETSSSDMIINARRSSLTKMIVEISSAITAAILSWFHCLILPAYFRYARCCLPFREMSGITHSVDVLLSMSHGYCDQINQSNFLQKPISQVAKLVNELITPFGNHQTHVLKTISGSDVMGIMCVDDNTRL